eukprot:352743-Chlamydomonas_euryale.AAC.29
MGLALKYRSLTQQHKYKNKFKKAQRPWSDPSPSLSSCPPPAAAARPSPTSLLPYQQLQQQWLAIAPLPPASGSGQGGCQPPLPVRLIQQ